MQVGLCSRIEQSGELLHQSCLTIANYCIKNSVHVRNSSRNSFPQYYCNFFCHRIPPTRQLLQPLALFSLPFSQSFFSPPPPSFLEQEQLGEARSSVEHLKAAWGSYGHPGTSLEQRGAAWSSLDLSGAAGTSLQQLEARGAAGSSLEHLGAVWSSSGQPGAALGSTGHLGAGLEQLGAAWIT